MNKKTAPSSIGNGIEEVLDTAIKNGKYLQQRVSNYTITSEMKKIIVSNSNQRRTNNASNGREASKN